MNSTEDLESDDGEPRSVLWSWIAVWIVVALAFASFANNGISVQLSFPLTVQFPAAVALVLWFNRRDPSRISVRLILAMTLAFSVTWLGVACNVENVWDTPPPRNILTPSGLPREEPRVRVSEYYLAQTLRPEVLRRSARPTYWEKNRYQWLRVHGASDEFYETYAITGFPLQRIEGHGAGGAPEWLPFSKGLWALIANFAMWTVAFLVLACAVPKRAAWWLGWAAVALAGVSGLVGWWKLLVLLD